MAATALIATARDDEFASRVLFLAMKTAQNVSTEDPLTTDDHDVRIAYAGRVIRGDDNAKMIATQVIASNPTISAAIEAEPGQLGKNVPDSDIEFALASIWTARSLAFSVV